MDNEMSVKQAVERDIYLNTINLWIKEAESRTNPACARNLMAHYCECIERGQQPPGPLLVYVARCFALTLRGQSFEQASGLKVKRGGTSKKSRNIELYCEYFLLRMDGMGSKEAMLHLATQGITVDGTVLDYESIRSALKPFIDEHKQLQSIVQY